MIQPLLLLVPCSSSHLAPPPSVADERRFEVATAIHALDATQLESLRGATLREVLSAVPRAGAGAEGVTVDGAPLRLRGLGEAPAPGGGPLLDLERIQVLRGPAEALYGGDAIAGAVSLVTRGETQVARFGAEDGQGVSLDFVPTLGASGNVVLEVRVRSTFAEAGPAGVVPVTRVAHGAVQVAPGETFALTGIVSEAALAAALDPTGAPAVEELWGTPVLGAFFRERAREAAPRNLVLFVTPNLLDEAGRRVPAGTGPFVVEPLPPARPGGSTVDVALGRALQSLPRIGWLRTELGGSIERRPLVAPDPDADGTSVGLRYTQPVDWSVFGTVDPQVRLDVSFLEASAAANEDLLSAGGLGLGIEDPNGSGFFVGPGNGDVQDLAFDLDYDALHIGLALEEQRRSWCGGWFDLAYGFRYGASSLDATFTGVTNSGTLDIRRTDEVDLWSFGPTLGATFAREVRGARASLTLDAMLGYGRADARSGVLVQGFPERARDLDDSQLVYELGATLGLRTLGERWTVGVEAGLHYGNPYPVVDYQPTGPAELDFGDQSRRDFRLTVGFRF